MSSPRHVFITGGTGYLGRHLIPVLAKRGHLIRALVRPGSEKKLPSGVISILGDPLDKSSYADRVRPSDTFIHLVGVSRPSPAKADQFRQIDRVSAMLAIEAAVESDISHFVYLSVAHPAPVMKAYISVRTECEDFLCSSGLNTTIVRPWYVLGPGHGWPQVLLPIYWVCELLPATREGARRLGLVTIDQMVGTLTWAVENPQGLEEGNSSVRVLEVPQIR